MINLAGGLSIISDDEIKSIHESSLNILQNIGLEVEDEKTLEMFRENGAEVDKEKSIVKVSKSMLEDAIDSAPSEVILYSRDGSHDLKLSGTNVYMGTGGTAVNVFDLYTGERRRSKSEDVINTARLVDNLEYVDFYVIPVFPNDFSKNEADEVRFFNAMRYTKKHIMGGVYTLEGIKKVIKLAREIAGSAEELANRPFISMITSIMSPLKMEKEYTKYMTYIIEQGIPIVAPPAPIAGATSPLTLAGTLAQMNAEALFGVIAAQLIKPGAKTLYGVVPTTMDMKTSSFRFGSIETGIMNAAGAQLAQFYDLPIYNTAGVSDSKIPDIESGYEKISNILLTALTGSNYIHDAAGLLDSGLSVAYEQYVVDNEIIGMVRKVLDGIQVNKEQLAFSDIKEVGPGGNFLTTNTTLKYMKTGLFMQKIFEPARYEEWYKEGADDARERARKLAVEIIENAKSEYVDKDIVNNIDWPLK